MKQGGRGGERESKANIIIYPHFTVTPISKMPSCETSCSLFGWTNKSQRLIEVMTLVDPSSIKKDPYVTQRMGQTCSE